VKDDCFSPTIYFNITRIAPASSIMQAPEQSVGIKGAQPSREACFQLSTTFRVGESWHLDHLVAHHMRARSSVNRGANQAFDMSQCICM